MAYSQQTWTDHNASYPVSAARMNHIEVGLKAIHDAVEADKSPDVTIAYNLDGTIATVTENGVVTTFSDYDTDGNVLTSTRNGIVSTYTYDGEGRLISIVST